MKTARIDLELYRTPGAKVFTGRPRGVDVRQKSKIDQLESENDLIEIVVPNDIASINPSFLEEFFENVVRKLGESEFYRKFKIINEGSYKIDTDLNEAVSRILRTENALP
jgi:hypothetical protein